MGYTSGVRLILVLIIGVLGFQPLDLRGQWMGEYLGGEEVLNAETKQVNQFFRRFNCEESPVGERFYPGDSLYHNHSLRKQYLEELFDNSNPNLSRSLKRNFIRAITEPRSSEYLDFHGGNWFAEVSTTFMYKGRQETMTLFMELEEADIGSKWVFSDAYFEPFNKWFISPGQDPVPPFIHPLSHELDFMNLVKVFRDKSQVIQYTAKNFKPDYLTLFLYEMKRGNLSFQTVNKVKFHFFQIDGWYFELAEFTRSGTNRGWLISQMTEIPEGQKEILLKFIFHQ